MGPTTVCRVAYGTEGYKVLTFALRWVPWGGLRYRRVRAGAGKKAWCGPWRMSWRSPHRQTLAPTTGLSTGPTSYRAQSTATPVTGLGSLQATGYKSGGPTLFQCQ